MEKLFYDSTRECVNTKFIGEHRHSGTFVPTGIGWECDIKNLIGLENGVTI